MGTNKLNKLYGKFKKLEESLSALESKKKKVSSEFKKTFELIMAESRCKCGHYKWSHNSSGCGELVYWGDDYTFRGFSEPCSCVKSFRTQKPSWWDSL